MLDHYLFLDLESLDDLVLFRFLKGISIILDTSPLKVYAIGVLSLIGMFAAVYFYLDYTQSASLHVTLLYNDILTRTH